MLGEIALLITAVTGGWAAVWVQGRRARSDAETAAAEAAKTRAETQQILAAVSPNHGSSMADAVNRIDQRMGELKQSIGGLRDDARLDRQALEQLRESADETHRRMDRHLEVLDRQVSRCPRGIPSHHSQEESGHGR